MDIDVEFAFLEGGGGGFAGGGFPPPPFDVVMTLFVERKMMVPYLPWYWYGTYEKYENLQ
jgi:hypothetical protein